MPRVSYTGASHVGAALDEARADCELAPEQIPKIRWSGKGSLLPCRIAAPTMIWAEIDRQGRPFADTSGQP